MKKKVSVKKLKPKATVSIENKPVQSFYPYEASIKVFGKIYKSVGASVKEAIEALEVNGTPRGVSVLTLSNGRVSKEKILNSQQVYRLFSASPLMRQIAIKNASLLFDL